VLPASASSHEVSDVLNREFPPNRTAPLEVVVGAPAGSPQVRALAARIRTLPDVSAVSPPQPAGTDTSLLTVAPGRGPLASPTQQLVENVRAIDEPVYVGVAGQTASFVDLEHSVGSHLPAVLGVVVGATLIVLFLLTGSVVLPVKAVLLNALNLSAVFGILVLIFQHGNLKGSSAITARGRSTPPSRFCCSPSHSGCPPTTACSCSHVSRKRATPGRRTPRRSRSGSSARAG
jgi:RND superfamily putative drug exporter